MDIADIVHMKDEPNAVAGTSADSSLVKEIVLDPTIRMKAWVVRRLWPSGYQLS